MILPSGAELKITVGSFAESKALYQAILEESKSLKIDAKTEMDINLLKDLFCAGFSSKKIESALEVCMKRVLYDGKRIDKDTFEAVEARQDYIPLCIEVAKENILPFTKALASQFKAMQEQAKSLLVSGSPKV